MSTLFNILIGGLCASLITGSAFADELVGDVQQGKTAFQHQCSVCHSLTANRVGPILSGVYGRKSGSVPEYGYSSALQSSTVVWDKTTLDKWLTSTRDFIPGQKMNTSISDPQKRADIIAYLQSISGTDAGK